MFYGRAKQSKNVLKIPMNLGKGGSLSMVTNSPQNQLSTVSQHRLALRDTFPGTSTLSGLSEQERSCTQHINTRPAVSSQSLAKHLGLVRRAPRAGSFPSSILDCFPPGETSGSLIKFHHNLWSCALLGDNKKKQNTDSV